jgi:hypothetical protein
MRNSLALLGIPDLPIYAFRHVGDRKIQPQGGGTGIPIVDEVLDEGGKLVDSASDVLASVDDTVNSAVPGGWGTVVSIAVPAAAPYVQAANAVNVLDKGGSLEDVAKNYAISQVAGEVGGNVGAETGSSLAGNVAGGTTGGLLSGKSLEQSLQGGLTSGAISQVTPSGLLSSGGTPDQGTTGANNMANDYMDVGYTDNLTLDQLMKDPLYYTGEAVSGNYGDPNAPQNSIYGYGGLGTENPTTGFGSTPMTPAQIDATMQTYGGSSSLDSATQALIKRALAAGGTAAQGAKNFLSSMFGGTSGANLLQGGLQTAGGLMQTQASKDAALKAQQDLLAATGSATAGSQFRPVGVTTRFGTSQFNINPATGQLESAGYTSAPEITSAQNKLLGLGASYLAQTPEEVAQQYLSKQYELLDPSRQRQLASIRNQAFQTGRGGLSVGSTGLRPSGAQGLMGANPEMEAYYNALAQQDAQLAAGAQQAGQQQVLYGAGLFGQAGNLESMAQQPFTLGTGLGTSISGAGANAGRLGLTGASLAAGYGTSPAATTSPGAYIASGLGSPTSTLGAGLANWLTSTAPTTGGITSQGMNAPTVDAYGNYVPLGYANY